MSHLRLPLMVMLLLSLGACAPVRTTAVPPTPPQPTHTPVPPQPTHTPAPPTPTISYVDGLSEVPVGHYLFVAVDRYTRCASACDCPVVEPVRPAYRYREGKLQINSVLRLSNELYGYSEIYTSWEQRDPDRPIVGLYGYWSESNATMHVIETLPWKTPDQWFTIRAADSRGALIVEGGGETRLVQPGEEWTRRATHTRGQDCQITGTSRLLNHGLLAEEQIHSSQ